MPLRLPFWGTPKDGEPPQSDPQPAPASAASVGDAVNRMIDARMLILKATLQARASYLRAQATATDSIAMKRTLEDRADEAEYLLGQIGG